MVLPLLEFPLGMVLSLLFFSRLVVVFLHSCKIPAVVFIVVFGGVAIWDRITKTVKKTRSVILVVRVGECVHAVDKARQDGERGKGTLFDAASCTKVE